MKITEIEASEESNDRDFKSYLGNRNKSTSNTQTLLKNLSQGDRTAFWQLWIPHQDYLYYRCLTWMDGNVIDAQDAISQATLKAWKQLFVHADKITNLKAWLTRFTHNVCIDIHRENGRKAIGVNNVEEIAGQIEVLPESESAFDGSEKEIYIRRAINALPLRLRSSFIMRFEQDTSYLDIAQKLDISLDNVYKRISQARAILKPQMNQYLAKENDSTRSDISPAKKKPTETNRHKTIQQEFSPILLTKLEVDNEVLHNQGMQCFYCQSTHISKNGHRRRKQNYLCHKCDRQFVNSCSFKGYPPEVREHCLNLSINGMGYRAISRETGVSYNTNPSFD